MTLVIAEIRNEKLCFATDSRISFGTEYVDVGVKLFEIPLKVINRDKEILYKQTWGLAGRQITCSRLAGQDRTCVHLILRCEK